MTESCRKKNGRLGCWLLGAALTASLVASPMASLVAGAPPKKAITFFVASDSHFGARGMEERNRSIVGQMNDLPGTTYPAPIRGRVETPKGLLFLGDMTDSGRDEEWGQFERIYGLNGRDGLLRFPIFEAIGNHDFTGDSQVKSYVRRRHGGIVYSWDWDDLHLVCLDMHPDATNLRWLARDLRAVGHKRPVVVFFHYSLEGPYSDFWEEEEKLAFSEAIRGFNVIAILHGHFHHAGHYRWRGHDVFRPGSPRHRSHQFLIVRVGAQDLSVAYWDFDRRDWADAIVKRISR